MTNDAAESNPEEAVPCFALSKNDSYVMSASGGKISLFNMMTFKVMGTHRSLQFDVLCMHFDWLFLALIILQTMATFMPPPPAATFLAFHPQDNNIIAIGMDDSTIQIYNVRVDEVMNPNLQRRILEKQKQCIFFFWLIWWMMTCSLFDRPGEE